MSKLVETFIDEEREIAYKCAATWGFLSSLGNKHKSIDSVFQSIMSGSLNPEMIKDVIECSLTHVNNEEVNDAKRHKVAVEIIERFGIQEASALARDMISRAMIGDIKKKSLEENLKLQSLMDQLFPNSKLSHFWSRGLLWVMTAALSGVAGSLILWSLALHT